MNNENRRLHEQITTLEKELSQLRKEYKLIAPILSQSKVGICFMKFDSKPLQWDDTTDKEAALDYAFDHLKITEVNQPMLDQYAIDRNKCIGLTPKWFFSLDIDTGRTIAKNLFNTGTHISNTRETKNNGETIIVNANYICLYNDENQIEGLFCAQKEMPEHSSFERTYETLYKNAPVPYQSLNAQGQLIRVNQKWCEETGYQEHEVIGKPFADLLSLKDKEKQAKLLCKLKQEGSIQDIDYDIITKSGKVINTRYEANIAKDANGNFLFTNCVFKNLTEEIKTQKRIQEQKNNFENFFNSIDSYLFILDKNRKIIDINEAIIKATQYSKVELIGKSIVELHPKNQRKEAEKNIDALIIGQLKHCPIPLERKDKTKIPVETQVTKGKWNGAPALFVVSKNISQLKFSELKFSKAFELNPAISGISDLETSRYIEVNAAFYETFHLTKEEVINEKVENLIHMDNNFRKEALRQLTEEGRIRNIETQLEAKNGIKIDALMSAEVIEIEGRKYNYTTAQNISERKIAESQLIKAKESAEQREREYRQLFENMTQGFALHKVVYNNEHEATDYTFISVNKAFEQLTGLKAKDCIGKTVLKTLPETEKYWIKSYAEVASTGEAKEFENYSKEIDKYFNVVAYCPEKGYFATIITDVTQKRKNEKALYLANEELKKAQEISHTGSWYMDAETKDVKWTNELYKTFGIDPQLPPPNFNEQAKIFTPESWGKLEKAINATIKTGHPYELELETVHRDGSNGWLWARGEQIKDDHGKTIGVWGASQDITRKKEIEIELQKAKEKAEIANIYKNQFLANMSHEIRTPMNGVVGFASLLRNKDLSDEKQNLYLDIIDSNSKQLLNLINDIIDIAKIEAGELTIHKEKSNLNQLLKETEQTFWSIKNEKKKEHVKIIAETPHKLKDQYLNTDNSRLRQILFNLIGNALKFTNKGEVRFGYNILNKDTIQFFVKDTGIGMPHHELNNIFKRFQQIEHKEQALYRGTGLGLAISKGLVQLLGGEIRVESAPEKGSQFYFTLPLDSSDTTEAKALEETNTPKASSDNKKTILIAEDEEMVQLYFKELFEDESLEIIYANNGKEAVDIYKNTPKIELVLMDIRMPIMGGEAAAKEILTHFPKAKIIAQTAFAMSGDEKSFLDQGFVDYIAKPINSKLLKEKIATHLND